MATTMTPAPDAPAPDNSVSRVLGAFVSPKATFESIVRRPTWVVPLLLLCVVQLGVTFTFTRRVGWRDFMEKQMQSNSRVEQLPADQREHLLDQQAKYAPALGYAAAVAAPFVGAVILGAIFLGLFNFLCGLNVEFKTALGIVSYAWVPTIIAGLLGILVIFLKDPSTVDLRNLIASNAGVLLSDDSPKWLAALLGSLDIFPFWTMLLMATGFGAINPKKVSFGKALACIVGLWVIYVIAKVSMVAAFS